MTRAFTALGAAVCLVLAGGPSEGEAFSSRRMALFGNEIPVVSIVSDSIGIGAEMGPLGRARHTFVRKLFDAGFVVHLNGRGLSQAADLRDEYATAVDADNLLWKVALVMLGTNDFALDRPLEEVRRGYASFLEEIMSSEVYGLAGQTLVCVTPLQRFDEDRTNGRGYTLKDLRVEIRSLCEARDLPCWDGTELLPADLGIAEGTPSRYFHDGVHPNRRGHKMVARALANLILGYYEALP